MENKPKNYLNDEHLSIGTREYLRVLNAGGRPVESLPVAEARKVLADVQAAVEVDLSGIDEREREIVGPDSKRYPKKDAGKTVEGQCQ